MQYIVARLIRDESTANLCKLMEAVVDSKPSHLLIVDDFNYKDIDWINNTVNRSDLCSHRFNDTVNNCFLFHHITTY